MIAFVRGVIFLSTSSGDKLKVSGSISVNTGFRPQYMGAKAVATNVKEGTITSLPTGKSSTCTASHRAVVPEFRTMECLHPIYLENSSSKTDGSFPREICPDSMTSLTFL